MSASVQASNGSEDAGFSLDDKLKHSQFDPIDFLNDTFPALSLSSQTQTQKASRPTQIQSVSADILNLLSTLNTYNIRSSSELTSLTDEIVRSGNRLAYEVEVLRGDVNGLHELLSESLRKDIELFVGEQLPNGAVKPPGDETDTHAENADETREAKVISHDPDFIIQLRMLGKAKARLEAVINIFGEAMKWPIPPSDISSSLISVSAPELGIQYTEEDEKAREVLRNIRAEITDLLNSTNDGFSGLEAASRRAEEYRFLAQVWKGTSEEKARNKFVDGLLKTVEDRKKWLEAQRASRDTRSDGSQRSTSAMGQRSKVSNEVGGAVGLFRNLQRLKDDLYLE
ncbi:uncharacterized protein A1O9_02259 [Exophiala aquamarina CBS 119918]|uniref:Uncharacterized protein n=1 Tax=Exophiala aquamarina CBS 119918 TaxID=1182545 RepID=A0A072PMY8_9EURO|nr:uncharacterized protein A1O9_02259 [Exophiala aquamarina CBS 119918]KEF60698.1 hypothetical protein A1O9_02259 [Exophiala aquamarina CBS 119918]